MVAEHFEVYSLGIVCASVCTSIRDPEAVAETMNLNHPTGIESDWAVSEDPTFKGGAPNPCQCEDHPGRLHWLLNC